MTKAEAQKRVAAVLAAIDALPDDVDIMSLGCREYDEGRDGEVHANGEIDMPGLNWGEWFLMSCVMGIEGRTARVGKVQILVTRSVEVQR